MEHFGVFDRGQSHADGFLAEGEGGGAMDDGAAGSAAHFLKIDVSGGAGLAAATRPQ